VAVNDNGSGLRDDQDVRSVVIVAFLGAGLPTMPPKSVLVDALSAARREVRACQARNAPIDSWLPDEIRHRGVRENAAVLAALELPEHRVEVAAAYRREHPDRVATLDALDAILTRTP
jgi:hypothetical protein